MPTKKTSYSDFETPISMAQDPKWSTDLQAHAAKMKRDFQIDNFVTSGFLPSPARVTYAKGGRELLHERF